MAGNVNVLLAKPLSSVLNGARLIFCSVRTQKTYSYLTLSLPPCAACDLD